MTTPSGKVGAVIVAAGIGRRLGGVDKAFINLGGQPLISWSVSAFQRCALIHRIVLVLNEKNIEAGHKLVTENSWDKVTDICLGGERRQDSVKCGLSKLKGCDWVVIHDGARPFVTEDLIANGLEAAVETGTALAGVPAKDTVKLAWADAIVIGTLPREHVWLAQTPQVFRSDIINEAYELIGDDVTDDAALVERLGHKVKLYMGSYLNFKITTPEDLTLAADEMSATMRLRRSG
jgi:2-C-methyl-D-erythritol 4-phosphate cytidylyltransferase